MLARINSGDTRNFSLTGWKDVSTALNPNQIVNFTGSGTAVSSPGVPTTASSGPLAGTKGLVTNQTLNFTTVVSGISTPNSQTTTVAYSADNGTVLVTQIAGVNTYYPAYAYPTAAKAGDAAQLYKSTNYTASYAVTAGDASSLVYTETHDKYDNAGNHLNQSISVYKITGANVATAVSSASTEFASNKAISSITLTFN